jgi:beta-glucosidase
VTGKVDGGAEVVRVYVESTLKELKAFDKVYLKAGESKKVEIALDKYAFNHWDEGLDKSVVKAGTYQITVGSSSLDKGLSARLDLKNEFAWRGL